MLFLLNSVREWRPSNMVNLHKVWLFFFLILTTFSISSYAEEAMIPDRVYKGGQSKIKKTGSGFCDGIEKYSVAWNFQFDEVDVNFLSEEGGLDLRFHVKNINFAGQSKESGPWACWDSGFAGRAHAEGGLIGLRIIPDPRRERNARIEVYELKLRKLKITRLSKTNLGMTMEIKKISPAWNRRTENFVNALVHWILKSSVSSAINTILSKEASRLVEEYFGEAPQSIQQDYDLDRHIDEELRSLEIP